ncbi:MAG: hypothetical protein ACRDE9_02895 [Candidatus Limnocylindria bacterium]
MPCGSGPRARSGIGSFVIQTIRLLDSRIANPAYVVVLLTGIGMVLTGAYSFTTGWILAAIGLPATSAR